MKHNINNLILPKVNDFQHQNLIIYQETVFQWEKKTDLIGADEYENFYQRHILNGLNLLQLLNKNDLIIHDIGTGAGLPGIVCRICDENLNRKYILFEKKYQKRSFLKNIIIKLNLKNIEVCEKYPHVSRETCDVLTSRALLSLNDIQSFKLNFKKFIVFKGKNYDAEIKFLNNTVKTDKIHIYKTLQDDSYLLSGESDECFT